MEIIIVATKQASKFLSNRKSLGFTDKHSVHFGDIVKGELDAGPLVWNGERWVVESHNVLIHSPQITNKDEAEALVASLQSDDKYETAIIGCDTGNTLYNLNYMLEEVFGINNVHIVYPSLQKNYTEFDSLRDRIRSLLDLPAVEEVSVESEDTVSTGTPQGEARHLRVTLTNTSMGGSAPSIIDVFFNEGDHLELDFRGGTGEAV